MRNLRMAIIVVPLGLVIACSGIESHDFEEVISQDETASLIPSAVGDTISQSLTFDWLVGLNDSRQSINLGSASLTVESPSSGTRLLSVCQDLNPIVYMDVDPGNGVLLDYPSNPSCYQGIKGYPMRKFRTWVWQTPPDLRATDITMFIGVDVNSKEVGYVSFHPQGSVNWHMEICARARTVYVDIDPGSGNLISYSSSGDRPCFTRDIGYDIRKFRIWTWSPAPAL